MFVTTECREKIESPKINKPSGIESYSGVGSVEHIHGVIPLISCTYHFRGTIRKILHSGLEEEIGKDATEATGYYLLCSAKDVSENHWTSSLSKMLLSHGCGLLCR